VAEGLEIAAGEIAMRMGSTFGDKSFQQNMSTLRQSNPGAGILKAVITSIAEADPARPLILFLDEVDALVGDTLISLLRQLRSGYDQRPASFPQSLILCGIRNLRDYRIHSGSTKEVITGGSAFNIKAESLTLGDFSRDEMEALYAQHTAATGQIFTREALDDAWLYTHGQPWLVNALGLEACFRMKSALDRTLPIDAEHLREAKERLVLRRDTHLDQLTERLKEARVRRVIEPMLTGVGNEGQEENDDVLYCRDLGLIRIERGHTLVISNAIYREIIPRELTEGFQNMMTRECTMFRNPDGSIDMVNLLLDFQQFYRESTERGRRVSSFQEAHCQLLLQAFLQRIINGGARIEREYGLGAGRTDLAIFWPVRRPTQKEVIEIKVIYPNGGVPGVVAQGLTQTAEYMDRMGATVGHLVIFDLRVGKTWEEKIYRRQADSPHQAITIWGM
jgi:hypothetical protein